MVAFEDVIEWNTKECWVAVKGNFGVIFKYYKDKIWNPILQIFQ